MRASASIVTMLKEFMDFLWLQNDNFAFLAMFDPRTWANVDTARHSRNPAAHVCGIEINLAVGGA